MFQRKILIIDGDRDILAMLKELFTQEGFEVRASANGQVLQTIPQFHPDIIVLDIQLPWLNGLEVSRNLKTDPATRNIPIILLSAHHQIKAADTSHVEAFIFKPFDLESLVELTERIRSINPQLFDNQVYFK